jgi:outer membrane lipoprotein-sorting protein
MKRFLILSVFALILTLLQAAYPDGEDILRRIDANMLSRTMKAKTTMIVQTRRASRTMVALNWSQGTDKAFSEYLSPAREQGTKMLKDGDNLWIYDPNTDRTIQISGNMLKQSVMGSDLSYEDMMEETNLQDSYSALVTGEKTYEGRDCWILQLAAKKADVTYQKVTLFVDKERFLPLYEERFAKSGKLLKTTKVLEVMQTGGRWYPKKVLYKDELKDGKGTIFIVNNVQFDLKVPAHIFTKAALKR